MKTFRTFVLILALCFAGSAHAQFFKKLKKRVEQAAEETVYRKSEEKAAEKTERAMDSILEAKRKKKKKLKKGKTDGSGDQNTSDGVEDETEGYEGDTASGTNLAVFRKFDFVPGEDIILYDDFSADGTGDFPSNWDSNGGGEIVEVDGNKWLRLQSGATVLPIWDGPLPKEFTAEFDVLLPGYPAYDGGPVSRLWVWIDESNGYDFDNQNRADVALTFWTALENSVYINNRVNREHLIRNSLKYKYHEEFYDKAHISVAVNNRRFRMWINALKVVDVPRLVPDAVMANFKMKMKDYKEDFLISNFKLASGGLDLRAQLMNEGKFSTTGILFDSGSATIKAESYGVLKSIATVLLDGSLSVFILGHTDADGNEDTNLSLSEQRAEAVKNILISEFGVDPSRLLSEGRGESEPVADNSTPEGKAKNRRVEFIKL